MMLAEHVTVSNGIVNLLNGGINRLVRPYFPAPMGVALVALIELPEDYENGQQIPVQVLVTSPDDSEVFGRLDGAFGTGLLPGFPVRAASPPIVVNLYEIMLSKAGEFKVTARLGDEPAQSLFFVIVQESPEDLLTQMASEGPDASPSP